MIGTKTKGLVWMFSRDGEESFVVKGKAKHYTINNR
jgi:hypothetical protein